VDSALALGVLQDPDAALTLNLIVGIVDLHDPSAQEVEDDDAGSDRLERHLLGSFVDDSKHGNFARPSLAP
jgi:hypothetical protein